MEGQTNVSLIETTMDAAVSARSGQACHTDNARLITRIVKVPRHLHPLRFPEEYATCMQQHTHTTFFSTTFATRAVKEFANLPSLTVQSQAWQAINGGDHWITRAPLYAAPGFYPAFNGPEFRPLVGRVNGQMYLTTEQSITFHNKLAGHIAKATNQTAKTISTAEVIARGELEYITLATTFGPKSLLELALKQVPEKDKKAARMYKKEGFFPKSSKRKR